MNSSGDDAGIGDETSLHGETVLGRSSQQVSVDLDGETVLLHAETGQYFTMNEVGSTVWSYLENPARVEDLLARIEADFDVAEANSKSDLREFLAELISIGVLEIEESEKTDFDS